MKFAHMADCHVGGWRDPNLQELSIESFRQAIDICIKENVAFMLISGDLFNTALPSTEIVNEVTSKLRELNENNIDTYVIPGSHDFSPSGKTMLDFLERAGLIHIVSKFKDGKLQFTKDKTNVKITGLAGKRVGLEKTDFETLDKEHLEKEPGFKIFMFHTTINEIKPKELEKIDGINLNHFPKNFNYYAGGHVHYIFSENIQNYGRVAYPGPLFPNSFKELEELKHGSFYIIDVDNENITSKRVEIKLKPVFNITLDANDKSVEQVEFELKEKLQQDLNDKILMTRIEGILSSGKPGDINLKEILSNLKTYSVLKNTTKLTSKEFEEFQMDTGTVDEVEEKIIEEHLGQIKIKDFTKEKERQFTNDLIETLDKEKEEGEKNQDFENRLIKDLNKLLKIEL